MKQLLAWIVGLGILLGAANPAGCFWVDDEMKTDVRPYAVIKAHHKSEVARYPNFVVTAIWIDESGYVIFVDWNGDGREDIAHIHQVIFYMENGTPVMICHGSYDPVEVLKSIDEYIRFHSA